VIPRLFQNEGISSAMSTVPLSASQSALATSETRREYSLHTGAIVVGIGPIELRQGGVE
jgi:hypothetical protein